MEQDNVHINKTLKEKENERLRKEQVLKRDCTNCNCFAYQVVVKFQKYLYDVASYRGEENASEETEKVLGRHRNLEENNKELSDDKDKLETDVQKEKDKLKQYKDVCCYLIFSHFSH